MNNPTPPRDWSQCRLIAAGIDTLDLGFFVAWPSDRLHERLAVLREDAMGTNGIQPPDCNYLVLPSGKPPMYRYHLQYPEGQVYLSGNPDLSNHPNVYVSISAKTLWLQGFEEAVNIFRRHVQALGGVIESILPSRVDLAADLVIPGGLSFDFLRSHLVTEARTLKPIFKDGKLETLYIGVGDLQLRIYNKWAEILHSDKFFFLDVWRDRLPDIGEDIQHVWRVEGQIRRPILKQYDIHVLEGFGCCLPGLWLSLTCWASLRVPEDANTSRRSLHPLWALVQSASALLGNGSLLLRRTQSESTAPVDWYVAHILGCLVGLAARLNVLQLAEALAVLGNLAAEYQSPQAFAARVQAEAIRLGMAAVTIPPP